MMLVHVDRIYSVPNLQNQEIKFVMCREIRFNFICTLHKKEKNNDFESKRKQYQIGNRAEIGFKNKQNPRGSQLCD